MGRQHQLRQDEGGHAQRKADGERSAAVLKDHDDQGRGDAVELLLDDERPRVKQELHLGWPIEAIVLQGEGTI
jgi:hypothetical protein